MNSKLDKIFHHIAFTTFWFLVIAIIISTFMLIFQWQENKIKYCMDKGYSEAICRGL